MRPGGFRRGRLAQADTQTPIWWGLMLTADGLKPLQVSRARSWPLCTVLKHAAGGQDQDNVWQFVGGVSCAATSLARPVSVGKPSPKMMSLPGWSSASQG